LKLLAQKILIVFLFAVAICGALYPTVSGWWNTRIAADEITHYEQTVERVDDVTIDEIFARAADFNERLAAGQVTNPFNATDQADYDSQLSFEDTSVMGYIYIPRMDVNLPIYHGTSDSVLASGVGHIEGTSLPIGGEGTHAVLSGHNGLPGAKLFTGLSRLQIGDNFVITVADRTITYEVDQILTVLPEDTSALAIEQGRDLCTLVTCTPYGINSHRLLVRGHRVPNVDDDVLDAQVHDIDWMVVIPLAAAAVMIAGCAAYLIHTHQRKKKER
jgi:sortase A